MGAEFRLVSLVQTTQVTDSSTGDISVPPVNAVFLVARVDVVRRSADPDLFCSFAILGPERRTWEPNTDYVSRDLNSRCPREEMTIGQPWPVEVIFQVPESYVGELAGVARRPGLAGRPTGADPAVVAVGAFSGVEGQSRSSASRRSGRS